MKERCEIRLPDLGLGAAPITVSVWLVAEGSEVVEGDRLLQVVTREVCVDLPSPISGILVEQSVFDDDEVVTGQVLGRIEESS